MEKIYILGKDNKYENASVLDEAINEQVKKNECRRKKRRNGSVSKDKGEVEELAPNDMHGGGEDPVV